MTKRELARVRRINADQKRHKKARVAAAQAAREYEAQLRNAAELARAEALTRAELERIAKNTPTGIADAW